MSLKSFGIRAVKLRYDGNQQAKVKPTGKVFYHDPVESPKGGKRKEFSREVDKLHPIAPMGSQNVFK